MKKEPDNCDLLIIFKDYEHQYKLVGTGLGVNVADLKDDPERPTNPLNTVFDRWKAANNEVTWGKIAEVCGIFSQQLGRVLSNIWDYLSTQKAHEKYLGSMAADR